MLLSLPDVPLRTTSFDVADRWLLWARMRMYPNRLVLVGWSLTGRYRRAISLDQIAAVDHTDDHLRLDVQGEGQVRIGVEEPVRWARLIRAQCNVRGNRT
jgi:hypothetical protein